MQEIKNAKRSTELQVQGYFWNISSHMLNLNFFQILKFKVRFDGDEEADKTDVSLWTIVDWQKYEKLEHCYDNSFNEALHLKDSRTQPSC